MARHLLILIFNQFPDWAPAIDFDSQVECDITTDRGLADQAAAVVYHIPTLDKAFRIPKRPGQLSVAWSMENDTNYPQLSDPDYIGQFDITMTYRRDASVWCPYFGPELMPDLLKPPKPKVAAAPIVLFASNPFDHTRRAQFVLELMARINVDSYGRVLRNRTLAEDNGRQTKLDVISQYRFTLALENSICQDYVTEKLYDPLLVGSVPIYLGAPNVDEFAPGDRCFINAADYQNAEHLADHIDHLVKDDASYQRYFDWKKTGLRPGFKADLKSVSVEAFCRLCDILQERSAVDPLR